MRINYQQSTINNQRGISLIEILVVIMIFAILGILISRVILVTLRGSGKSDSLVKIRENLDYSLSIIEREIRNAETISCPSATQVNYTNSRGTSASFSCQSSRVASGSAWLTSDEVSITACSFICTAASGHVPPSLTVSLEAKDASVTGAEAGQATATTKIFLRTY
jgi:prepilin-type N-terminal cleavage/methylation domain-containing protein